MPRGDGTGPYGTGPIGGFCRRNLNYSGLYPTTISNKNSKTILQNEKLFLQSRIDEINEILGE
ncbi:DUF5320 domain-containing protein [Sedimentibacter sp. zth1]|uniref:DUF5320 domain-containing protein n=1 Tax=Sedimentibacter sp. zth1 TaxID=2816908 RepID=UPI001A918500|nr:DUF5320 domain-containing protein [Sedimentibacter sp. zth1]QSX05729.1 DUF5320 domain-containing protein [Sedimentibacter sp. zth1]